MAKRIEKLIIQGFRGATCPVEINFDTTKPIVMIFGENGTGKSSIVDAIDFVCNGELGSLTYRSSTSPKSHLPALGSDTKNLKIELSLDGRAWTAIFGKKGPEITGSPDRPTARILRRSIILDIVDAQPKERYEALQTFIAVPSVQRGEISLREALKRSEQELNEANRSVLQANESLETLWKAENSLGTDYWVWAKSESAKNPAALVAEIRAIDTTFKELSLCLQARTSFLDAETNNNAAKESLKKAKEIFAVAQAKAIGANESLINLLKDTEVYLKKNTDVKNCPVCEQIVDANQLQTRIANRLAEIKDAVELKKIVDTADKNVTDTFAIVQNQQLAFISAVKRLATSVKNSALPELMALGIDWSKFSHFLNPEPQSSEPATVMESRDLLKIFETCQTPLKIKHTNSSKSLAQLNAIKNHVNLVEEKKACAENLTNLSTKLSAMLEVVEKARKAYVTSILAAISGIVQDLYLEVHPDEGIGGIRFYLKPNVQGSLEFDGKFQSATEVPPQAYYSESHLDTLGVCIFLAFARHFHDGNTIVVLDDVVTSVDQAHVARFMNMLHTEAARYNQLIVTTHYRPWRERYRFARGPAANVQLVELLHWSLSRGIRHTKTKLAIDDLKALQMVEPLERQSVSSKAGILMESLLDHLALLYECKVPRKAEPDYTLGELTSCIPGKLRKVLKVQHMSQSNSSQEVVAEIAIESLLTEISSLSWIRNKVGCHWNLSGIEVSDAEVNEFVNLTIKFAESLICEHCGEIPRVEKSGSYHQCGCGRTRLYPCNNPD
ncbi:MAG: AAA family ATPase [Thermodesulfobacteriota bacterium]|nr:AAA family ATPase [Thermodesulfobacteriota bacterium]